jgi:hypothetical protein
MNGEVDLHLVQPAGIDRRVNQHQLWVRALQTLHGSGTAVSRTVVYDPEDAASIVVRRSRRYLLDEPVKGSDPILGLTTAQDSGMVNIQTDDVSPGSTPEVFVFHLHGTARTTGASGVLTPPSLDAGFFVCRNHELIVFQTISFPCAGIPVEDPASFVGEMGSRGKIQLRWYQGRIAS